MPVKLLFETLPRLVPGNPVVGMGLGVSPPLIQELFLPIEKPGAFAFSLPPELLQKFDPFTHGQTTDLTDQFGLAHRAFLHAPS